MFIIIDTYTGELVSSKDFSYFLSQNQCPNCNTKLGLQRKTPHSYKSVVSSNINTLLYSEVYDLLPKYNRHTVESLLMCKHCNYIYTIITKQHRIKNNRGLGIKIEKVTEI